MADQITELEQRRAETNARLALEILANSEAVPDGSVDVIDALAVDLLAKSLRALGADTPADVDGLNLEVERDPRNEATR